MHTWVIYGACTIKWRGGNKPNRQCLIKTIKNEIKKKLKIKEKLKIKNKKN